jgi:DNA (cytosine-5)-methyltransferase 1
MATNSTTNSEKTRLARSRQAKQLAELTGWEVDPKELGDFYHNRIRRFPEAVSGWRRAMVERIRKKPDRFPAVPAGSESAELRQRIDGVALRLRELATILAVLHGSPGLGNHPDPVDELVYIILSRKTREDAYQSTFEALKKRFKTWEELLEAPRDEVEQLVRPGGLPCKKVESLYSALEAIRDRFGSCSLDDARSWSNDELEDFLVSLPEISRKSAYCVMMYSMQREVFPVDTHVGRVLARIEPFEEFGIALDGLDHKQLQAQLADLVPPVLRYSLHVNLVCHGRAVCIARNPRCSGCEIRKFCRTYRRQQVEVARTEREFTFVDFFCGAGGLSTGLVAEGMRPTLAVDTDELACRTFRLNHPQVEGDSVLCEDVRRLSIDDIRATLDGRDLDILAGGPPCQGFSLVGERSKRRETRSMDALLPFNLRQDPRNFLYQYMIGAALELRPRIVLMENVPGMTSRRKGGKSFMEQAAAMLEDGGYTTAVWLLEASAYGVPERRRRAFLIGSRDGRLPLMPEADYQQHESGMIDPDALDPNTVESAIFDLPPLEADSGFEVSRRDESVAEDDMRFRYYLTNPGFKIRSGTELVFNHRARYNNERDLELFELLKPGENGLDAIERYGRRDLMRYRTDVFDDKYSRLRPDHPCRTIVSHLSRDGNSFIHPSQVRSITVREAARIQSFPDDFVFCGSPSDQWIQVGNAVPPVLARALARTIINHLRRNPV